MLNFSEVKSLLFIKALFKTIALFQYSTLGPREILILPKTFPALEKVYEFYITLCILGKFWEVKNV